MKNKGFTLIELLAVVLIIGILTAIAVPQYRKSLERSRVAEAYMVAPAIYDSVRRWADENNKKLPSRNINPILEEDVISPWTAEFDLNMLDINLKGKRDENDAHKWQTKNFEYAVFKGPCLLNANRAGEVSCRDVLVTFRRGKYKDLQLSYKGGKDWVCYGDAIKCGELGITFESEYLLLLQADISGDTSYGG